MIPDDLGETQASGPSEVSAPGAVPPVLPSRWSKIMGSAWIVINILILNGAFWYFLQLGHLFEPTGWKEHLAGVWHWVGSLYSIIPLIFAWTFLGIHAGLNMRHGKSWAGEIVEMQAYLLIVGLSYLAAWKLVDYTIHRGFIVSTVSDPATLAFFKVMMVFLLGGIIGLAFLIPIFATESKYRKIPSSAKEDLHWLLTLEGKHYSEGQVPEIGPGRDK